MSYSAQHIRYTLECDACGIVEKRDLRDSEDHEKGTKGWGIVEVPGRCAFCCPSCLGIVEAVLTTRQRQLADESAQRQANCRHHYQQRGLLAQCTKCAKWKP